MPATKQWLKRLAVSYAPRTMTCYQRLKGVSEPEQLIARSLCDVDKLFLDIGADRGTYTLWCLPFSKGVITFEPVPERVVELKYLFSRCPQVRVEPVALSDTNGDALLRIPDSSSGLASIHLGNLLNVSNATSLTVKTRTLDSYHLTSIGFIKIDVEGHEESVLRGSMATISSELPNMQIEIEERHNPGSVERVLPLLSRLDYVGFFLGDGKLLPIDQFTPEMQSSDRLLATTKKDRCTSSIGRYINNFIFRHRSRLGT